MANRDKGSNASSIEAKEAAGNGACIDLAPSGRFTVEPQRQRQQHLER